MISVYNKKTAISLGPRKIELLNEYVDVINRGRSDPVWFIENFLNVQLLDYQKWIIASAWTKETVCLVCSRNTGKSFIASLYIMARAILFPNQKIWIMSQTARQAQTTFRKMEDIAKQKISSVKSDAPIFVNEVVKSSANTDGFLHEKQSYSTTLYNGSTITTLVGKAETIVGMRSNLSVFDEAALISKDFFARTVPFTTQDANFATGENIDTDVYPQMLPNQNLYLSSAGSTTDHLYDVYKRCAKRMVMGFNDCFVADISCEVPLAPTINGKPYKPLFNKNEVEEAMRLNPYRALREYYNLFDQMGGTDMVVSRDMVLRNERDFLPVFSNNNPNVLYGIFFDPALQADNAFVLIAEYFKDEEKGWMMRLVNGINLLQVFPNGDKRPMRSTEQLEHIHQFMLDYNGKENEEYIKIHLMIDPGSGGGGRIYADFLIQEWVDDYGVTHKGVYDEEDETSKLEAVKFPKALKGVLSLPSAQKYKNEMFAALSEMAQEDLILWPPIPQKGKLEIEGKTITLTQEEIRALAELDLMREEIWLMRKTKTEAGNVRYALQADMQRKAHDDRAYTLAMAAFYLAKIRRDEKFNIDVPIQDMSVLTNTVRKANGVKQIVGQRINRNPFANRVNPFTRRR